MTSNISENTSTGRPAPWATARPDPAEQARLAAGLGAILHADRVQGGWSTRRLAVAAGCSRSSVRRLETGERRPRRSMLAALAGVLDPAGAAGLTDRLVAAAGASLRPERPFPEGRRRVPAVSSPVFARAGLGAQACVHHRQGNRTEPDDAFPLDPHDAVGVAGGTRRPVPGLEEARRPAPSGTRTRRLPVAGLDR